MGAALAEWRNKFWKERESKTATSDYWLRDSLFTRAHSRLNYTDDEWDHEKNVPKKESGYDAFALAKYLRAIGNFVHILTRDNKIRVKFNTAGNNSTDGETVYLSADIEQDKFDIAVGLALHEASHILYTDFRQFKEWMEDTPEKIIKAYPHYAQRYNAMELCKSVFNIIEDRFIDAMTYKEAPGYRGYYSSLYIEYFGSKAISKAFYNSEFKIVNQFNYLFHLANIANPDRNVNALPHLDKIIVLIDLPNILRLATTKHRLELSQIIVDIIAAELNKASEEQSEQGIIGHGAKPSTEGDASSSPFKMPNLGDALKDILDKMDKSFTDEDEEDEDVDSVGGGQGGDGEEDGEDDGNGGAGEEDDEDEEDGDEDEADDEEDGDEEDNDEDEADGEDEEVELSQSMIKRINNIIKKQTDLINGELKKKKINTAEARMIDDIAAANVEIATVSDTANGLPDTKVYVIENVTPSMIGSDLGMQIGIRSYTDIHHTTLVEDGIREGRILANKLQLRVEDRVLTSTRLKSGRLDKRLLAEIGYDNYEVFKRVDIHSYAPSFIHVSLDSSGSMAGSKWSNTIKLAASLATAATLVPNVRVVITCRSTLLSGLPTRTKRGRRGSTRLVETPFIATIFDSKRHGISQIRAVFPYITQPGMTPEGICFQAIMKNIIRDSANTDAYFINICDGEPSYSNGEAHTTAQRKILEKHGIKILAYYVYDNYERYGNRVPDFFTSMYGKDNSFVATGRGILEIAKTINRKLLEV